MKKLNFILVFLMVAFIGTNAAKAQGIVKVNYLSIVLSTINVAYEAPVSDKASLQLQGYYWLGGSLGDVKYSGYGVTPEMRLYPGGEVTKGFFLAPYARYQNWSIQSDVENYTAKANMSTVGGGVAIGGQWIFGDKISLDLWGGPGYNITNISYEQGEKGDIDPRGEGFTIRFGTTVGLKF